MRKFTIYDLRFTIGKWLLLLAMLLGMAASQAQFVPGGSPVFGSGGSGGGSGSGTNNYYFAGGTNIVVVAPMVIGTIYTNTTGSNLLVSCNILMAVSDANTHSITLRADNDLDGSYEQIQEFLIDMDAVSGLTTLVQTLEVSIIPGGRYTLDQADPGATLISTTRTYSGIGAATGGGGGVAGPTFQNLTDGTNAANVLTRNSVADVVTNGTVPTFANLTSGTNSVLTALANTAAQLITNGAAADGSGFTNVSSLGMLNPGVNFPIPAGVDGEARRDLTSYANQLSIDGFWSNHVDSLLLFPRFAANGMTNTLMGRTVNKTGTAQGRWGSVFSGSTDLMTVNGLTPVITNTIVLVYRCNAANAGVLGSGSFVGGMVNTNDNSAFWLRNADTWAHVLTRNNSTQEGLSGNTGMLEPFQFYSYCQSYYQETCDLRKVVMISYGGTNGLVRVWYQGVTCGVGFGGSCTAIGLSFTNTTAKLTTNLTQLRLGLDITTGFGGDLSFKGEIAYAAVFNCDGSTNLALSVIKAERFLENDTVNRVWLGDSLFTKNIGSTTTYRETNSIPYWFQASEEHATEVCWDNLSLGGTFASELGTFLGTGVLTPWIPHGKVKRTELFLGHGFNDLYGNADSPGTVLSNLQPIISYCQTNGISLYFVNVQSTRTNAANFSDAGESNRLVFNALVLTNVAARFAGVFDRSQFVDQFYLNPLNGYVVTDGIHFWETNGWMVNRRIANALRGTPIRNSGQVIAGDLSVGGTISGNASGLTGIDFAGFSAATKTTLTNLTSFSQNFNHGISTTFGSGFTRWVHITGATAGTSASVVALPLVEKGRTLTISDLYVSTANNIGAGTNFSAAIGTNGVASDVSISVLGAAASFETNDLVHSTTVTNGSRLALVFTGNNPTASSSMTFLWSFKVTVNP